MTEVTKGAPETTQYNEENQTRPFVFDFQLS